MESYYRFPPTAARNKTTHVLAVYSGHHLEDLVASSSPPTVHTLQVHYSSLIGMQNNFSFIMDFTHIFAQFPDDILFLSTFLYSCIKIINCLDHNFFFSLWVSLLFCCFTTSSFLLFSQSMYAICLLCFPHASPVTPASNFPFVVQLNAQFRDTAGGGRVLL